MHHAHMVRRGKGDGIAIGFVEEGGFPGEDSPGVLRFLDVDPSRSAAILGARGGFPSEPGGIVNSGGDALPQPKMAPGQQKKKAKISALFNCHLLK